MSEGTRAQKAITPTFTPASSGVLQRAAISSSTVQIPPIVHEVLRSPGQPLDAATRTFMEPRFGHNFSGVRVHVDTKAAESARAVNALAYTVGRDVVFGEGQHEPTTNEGRKLMAHELAHTIQQGEPTIVALSSLALGQADDAFERVANAAADAIDLSATRTAAPLSVLPTARMLLQRQPAKTGDATPVPIKGSMPAIFFQFDSTELRHDAEDDSMIHFVHALTKIQEHVKKNGKAARITLHGFASVDGEKAHNLALSQKRADRVKELLVEAGIPEAQITAIGHGGDSTFPGLAWNRRVSIELTPTP
jgi:outer membrane protein OmpA-like peptidoglycan-associated protein